MNGFMPLIELTSGYLRAAFLLVIHAALWGALLVAVPLLLNLLFRRWLTARQLVFVWGIVLLRLLLPVAPSSAFSLQNLARLMDRMQANAVRIHDDGTQEELGPLTGSELAALGPSSETGIRVGMDIVKVPTARELAEGELEFTTAETPLFTMLSGAWLTIAVAYLLWTVVIYRLFVRKLAQYPPCEDGRIHRLWKECCERAGTRRQVPIVMTSGDLRQPAVLGVFRPKLLLPGEVQDLRDDELRMIMLHELGHLRYRDVATNWLLAILRAFYWWNPVCWLATARIQSLQEQACDAFAIQRMPGGTTREYGELLLSLAAGSRGPGGRLSPPASILGLFPMIFRKRAMANRIRALRSAGNSPARLQLIAVAVIVLLFAGIALTDARSPEWEEEAPGDSSIATQR